MRKIISQLQQDNFLIAMFYSFLLSMLHIYEEKGTEAPFPFHKPPFEFR